MQTKEYRCGHCRTNKPLAAFPPSKATRNGCGQWCRDCLTAAVYMKKYLAGELRYPFKVAYWRYCGWCGAGFQGQAKSLYCSRSCKDRAQARARQDVIDASKPPRACPHCGKALTRVMRKDAVYCSAACNSAAHQATRKASWKIGGRQERVSRAYIIERDGSRCHACRKVCRPEEIHLDHLVPLSRGGTHAPENVAVACATCNLTRNNRGESQLLLLG